MMADVKPQISVAMGLIYNQDGEILISLRRHDQDFGGLWEFPGGKININETPYAALCRELSEEIAITVEKAIPLIHYQHDYPEKKIDFHIWKIAQYTGIPIGNEQQKIQWARISSLGEFNFPSGNQPILDLLKSTTLEYS